jgi:parallel beta-helix repeat protein
MINADKCLIQNITITKNSETENAIGIKIKSSYNNISNITVTNLSEGFYLDVNSKNNTISWCNILKNVYGIYTDTSSNNNITNNYIFNNQIHGILLGSFSENNIVSSNCISFNNYGIRIKGSKNNKIINNVIKNNVKGLYCCCGGYFNIIILNTFKNNTEFNAAESFDLKNDNYWNTDNPPYFGNYWRDYTGIDQNDDGI